MRPLFLLSPPRSGSTLVQRVLAAHAEIATTPEPWILLPHLYAARERGAFAEYGHGTAARAIKDFAASLPGGEHGYRRAVAAFVRSLYEQAAGARPYFLDKTPRYYFIVDELFELFPDAKVVFLWRNPLAVVASIVDTWTGGAWRLDRWHRDLFDGVPALAAAFERHANRSCAVRFEDLVQQPERTWADLHAYLGLSFDPGVLTRFASVSIGGRMGDPTGRLMYSSLSAEPLVKWKSTLASPVRKRWARRYLRHLGEHCLRVMGYDIRDLENEIDAIRTRPTRMLSDQVSSWLSKLNRLRRETGVVLSYRPGGPRYPGAQSKGQSSSP